MRHLGERWSIHCYIFTLELLRWLKDSKYSRWDTGRVLVLGCRGPGSSLLEQRNICPAVKFLPLITASCFEPKCFPSLQKLHKPIHGQGLSLSFEGSPPPRNLPREGNFPRHRANSLRVGQRMNYHCFLLQTPGVSSQTGKKQHNNNINKKIRWNQRTLYKIIEDKMEIRND
jgi:hypothetical protein